MNHFRDDEWLDYVRGLSPETQRAAMERSLNGGCEFCRKLFEYWSAANEAGVRDAAYRVPDEAVEAAVSAYTARSRYFRVRATATKARLVFDSFLRPAFAGVRGAAVGSRRLLERRGRWMVDLRLESEANNRLSLVGQVLQSGEQADAACAGLVFVMSGDDMVANTNANQFSEFQMQFPVAPNLRLYVEIQGEPAILVALPDSVETNLEEDAPGVPDDV
jgi:hypothetical protein